MTKFITTFCEDGHTYIADIKGNQMPKVYHELKLNNQLSFIFSTSVLFIDRKKSRLFARHHANSETICIYPAITTQDTTYILPYYRAISIEDVAEYSNVCVNRYKKGQYKSISAYIEKLKEKPTIVF